MAEKYIRLYAMEKVTIYKGATIPDSPDAPALLDEEFIEQGSEDGSEDKSYSLESIGKGVPNPPETVDSWIGLGVNVQSALYQDENLRKSIRMYTIGKANTLYPGSTKFTLNNFKDGVALGAFRLATLTLQAKDNNRVYPLFGQIHSTTRVISAIARVQEMSAYFSTADIRIGNDNVLYNVVPGSFKIKAVKPASQEIA